ncbi:hypothetical protein MMC17_008771 [Xylographa soralifera]|nr:hypothetical protein [Xylographa soralifera]
MKEKIQVQLQKLPGMSSKKTDQVQTVTVTTSKTTVESSYRPDHCSDVAESARSPQVTSAQTNKLPHDGGRSTRDEYNWLRPKALGYAKQLNCPIGDEKTTAATTKGTDYKYDRPEATDFSLQINGKMCVEAFEQLVRPGGKKGE